MQIVQTRTKLQISFDSILSLGYLLFMENLKQAARALGLRSAEVRTRRWGKDEFVRKMREWGKLGGRPRKHISDGDHTRKKEAK